MPKVELKQVVSEKSSSRCYEACQHMVEKAGYKIFKKRDIASLLICEGTLAEKPVNLTVMIPFGNPTHVIINLSGDQLDEIALNSEGARLFALLQNEL